MVTARTRTRSGKRRAIAQILLAGMIAVGVTVTTGETGERIRGALTLLWSTDPLTGSTTALILGGTTQPTPSADYARTVEELFLRPLGFGADDESTGLTGLTVVCTMDGTDPCSAPLQVLTTPELIQQGLSSLTAASDVVLAVRNEFDANPGAFDADHPLTIFGYSQSATAESLAMARLDELGIPRDALHFVFIGDPSTPDGIWQHLESAMASVFGADLTRYLLGIAGATAVLGSETPTDLYPTTIYSLPDDPVPNFVDSFEKNGPAGALLNVFGPHVQYLGLTPDQVADATTTVDGQVTYIDINSDDINGLNAWLSAVFLGGAANSGLFDSLWNSVELFVTDTF